MLLKLKIINIKCIIIEFILYEIFSIVRFIPVSATPTDIKPLLRPWPNF